MATLIALGKDIIGGSSVSPTPDVPDGKTVTPINDVAIWQQCAGLTSTYTTLDEVLADSGILSALMASENAVDYMVRSTTWAASIALVPTMISNTEPSGIVTVSGVYNNDSAYAGYKAFDRNDNTLWLGTYADANAWIGYEFEDEITVRALTCRSTQNGAKTFTIQTSINGTDWSVVSTHTIPNDVEETISITPTTSKYWRLQCSAKYGDMCGFREIQFHSYSITENQTAMSYIGLNNYCANTLLADSTWREAICNSEYFESVLNVKVPTMTSNMTPSGECFCSGNSDIAYRAFDSLLNTEWSSNVNSPSYSWVAYEFDDPVNVWIVELTHRQNLNSEAKIEASNDRSTWTDISDGYINLGHNIQRYRVIVDGSTPYLCFRDYSRISEMNDRSMDYIEVQFYGRKDI